MKFKVCILVNQLKEFNSRKLLEIYLPPEKFNVVISDAVPDNPSAYQIIVAWSYRRVIERASEIGNIVVIHSTELPYGRGWAPIYNTLFKNKKEYVISCIYADNQVDAGDVIARVRFEILPEYTATYLRKLDEELSLLLVAKIFDKWPDGVATGIKQAGEGSYYSRRYPADNEINPEKSVLALLPHLRAVEKNAPAYFYYQNIKYLISICPEVKPRPPAIVRIEYPALNINEDWAGWHDPT